MHTKDAAVAGEGQQRLHLVAAWREATVFTEAERAALELAEQGTRIADASEGVSDDVWHAPPSTTTRSSSGRWSGLVALINLYNRLNVIVRQPAGDYEPGQWS